MSEARNSAPDSRAWRTLSEQELLAAPPWLRVSQQQVQLPSGTVIPDFYRIELPEFVSIFATTVSGELLFVRGYKHGIGSETLSPPAGLLEAGEDPLTAARRELLEETGYAGEQWQLCGAHVVDANRHCGRMHLALVRDVRPVARPRADETEVLTIALLSRDEVREALLAGEIKSLAGAATASLGLVYTERAGAIIRDRAA